MRAVSAVDHHGGGRLCVPGIGTPSSLSSHQPCDVWLQVCSARTDSVGSSPRITSSNVSSRRSHVVTAKHIEYWMVTVQLSLVDCVALYTMCACQCDRPRARRLRKRVF